MTRRAVPGRRPPLSVVIATHNEGANLVATVRAQRETTPAGTEIIVVDDSSTDSSIEDLRAARLQPRIVRTSERLGPPRSRNVGARLAQGEVLLWSDAHVIPDPGWFDALSAQLADPSVGAVGPGMAVMGNERSVGYGMQWKNAKLEIEWLRRQSDRPYPVPMIGGAFVVTRRDVFEATGGFDDGLVFWGGGDAELSCRLWLLGYEIRVVPKTHVAHLFRARFPYPVEAAGVLHNLLRIAVVHFERDRLEVVLNAKRTDPTFGRALARLAETDAFARRDRLRAQRARDDAWFFERWPMPELTPAVDVPPPIASPIPSPDSGETMSASAVERSA